MHVNTNGNILRLSFPPYITIAFCAGPLSCVTNSATTVASSAVMSLREWSSCTVLSSLRICWSWSSSSSSISSSSLSSPEPRESGREWPNYEDRVIRDREWNESRRRGYSKVKRWWIRQKRWKKKRSSHTDVGKCMTETKRRYWIRCKCKRIHEQSTWAYMYECKTNGIYRRLHLSLSYKTSQTPLAILKLFDFKQHYRVRSISWGRI